LRISGPQRYTLEFKFKPDTFSVVSETGTAKFSGIATSKKPKLYIVSFDGKPVYVGVTRQPLRNRLRFGWNATGEHGYHGYAFRHVRAKEAFLDVWCHEDAPVDKPALDIETIEAEVVFLIRCTGEWPAYQTEIHFHRSNQRHRDVASAIFARYEPRRRGAKSTLVNAR